MVATPEPVEAEVAIEPTPGPTPGAPRTARGRKRQMRGMTTLTPLEQIRAVPNSGVGTLTGAWAYYINPNGATIRDALILYPNGGVPPNTVRNWRRYGENADYYRARQARKGLEYVGRTLDGPGVRRLVEVLQTNQADEILDLEDQISDVEQDITNSDRPEVRDNQRKRRGQLQTRLSYVRTPLDAEALSAELNEIARAQRMASISPEAMAVFSEMLDTKFAAAVAKFQSSAPSAEAQDASESYR